MNKKEIEAFGREAAKNIKTPQDLTEFSQALKKVMVEAALNAEMKAIQSMKYQIQAMPAMVIPAKQ